MGGMTRLLLLLCAGVTVSTAVDLQKRVVGGKDCSRDYHVYVKGFDGTDHFMCGGSLISKDWILTAAHCQKRDITAYVGPGQRLKREIIQRKIYYENGKEHDIMLLKMSTSVNFQPVKLPTTTECLKRDKLQTVQIAGYASTTKGPNNERQNDFPGKLMCADIPVINCAAARNSLQGRRDQLSQSSLDQHWFCGQSCSVDVAPGDSGGGAVHGSKIYGVNSFTFNGKFACRSPAAFMDVCKTKYKTWIRIKTGLRTI